MKHINIFHKRCLHPICDTLYQYFLSLNPHTRTRPLVAAISGISGSACVWPWVRQPACAGVCVCCRARFFKSHGLVREEAKTWARIMGLLLEGRRRARTREREWERVGRNIKHDWIRFQPACQAHPGLLAHCPARCVCILLHRVSSSGITTKHCSLDTEIITSCI